jgi:hypothetical protein
LTLEKPKPKIFPRVYKSNFYPMIKALFENENFKYKRYSVLVEILDNDMEYKRRVSLSGYYHSESDWQFYRRINQEFALFEAESYNVTIIKLIISKLNE